MISSELLQRAFAGSISPEDFDRKLREMEIAYEPRLRFYDIAKAVLYRARDLEHLARPSNSSELSYPPCDAAGIGRANAKGAQVFYGSPQFAPSFMECGFRPGEHIISSRWQNISRVVLREIGFEPEQDATGVDRILHELFTTSQSSIYAYSAHVARRMMSDRFIAGLVYPSGAVNGNGENVALKASAADKLLRLNDAALYKVKKSSDNAHVIEPIDFARAGENGELLWLGKPAAHSRQIKIVSQQGEYHAYDDDGGLFEAA